MDSIPQNPRQQGRPLKNNGACTKCGETDPDQFYYKTVKEKKYKFSRCKKCHYEGRNRKWYAKNKERNSIKTKQWMENHPQYLLQYKLQSNYGLSLQDFERLLTSQNGVCKICLQPPLKRERLYVDHNHETGEVRGLLCRKCNFGLGSFRDNSSFLRRAADYLDQ